MAKSEEQILNLLIDLKENHNITGLKSEFEAEGASLQETIKLKEFAALTGLDYTIKLGGCEAIKDMYEAKSVQPDRIVAPMIETPYAMQKFVNAQKKIFANKKSLNISFFINIETITGYKNLTDIINMPEFQHNIDGIVMGRTDLTASLNLNNEEINSDYLLNIAADISSKINKTGKKFIIGGGITTKALPFLKRITNIFLSEFETRKVIFGIKNRQLPQNTEEGIIKTLKFELLWLKYKYELNGFITIYDKERENYLLKILDTQKTYSLF